MGPRDEADDAGAPRDSGTGMLEVMVSIALIGTIVLATIAGTWTNARASNDHRHRVVADALLRNTAESILSPAHAYVACAPASSYASEIATDPTGAVVVTVASVRYWNGASPPAFTATCGPDFGAVEVTLRATSTRNGTTTDLQFIKRSSL